MHDWVDDDTNMDATAGRGDPLYYSCIINY